VEKKEYIERGAMNDNDIIKALENDMFMWKKKG
jgi:hypothetical protein